MDGRATPADMASLRERSAGPAEEVEVGQGGEVGVGGGQAADLVGQALAGLADGFGSEGVSPGDGDGGRGVALVGLHADLEQDLLLGWSADLVQRLLEE